MFPLIPFFKCFNSSLLKVCRNNLLSSLRPVPSLHPSQDKRRHEHNNPSTMQLFLYQFLPNKPWINIYFAVLAAAGLMPEGSVERHSLKLWWPPAKLPHLMSCEWEHVVPLVDSFHTAVSLLVPPLLSTSVLPPCQTAYSFLPRLLQVISFTRLLTCWCAHLPVSLIGQDCCVTVCLPACLSAGSGRWIAMLQTPWFSSFLQQQSWGKKGV